MRSIFYEILAALGQHTDFQHIQAVGKRLGRLIWHCAPSRRELAIATISERLGLDKAQATAVAQSSFAQNGRSFLEILLCRKVDWRFTDKRLLIDDPQRLSEVMEALQGRPCVAATAHLGAWELLGGLLHLMAPQKHKQVVVKATRDQDLYALIKRMRSHPSVHIVEHEQAAPKVLRNLKRMGLSAFLVDHNCQRREAVFLPFLGRLAAVNVGPALLALRSKAQVWPIFLIRQEPDRYRLIFDSPLDTRDLSGDRHEKMRTIAQFYTNAVERTVQSYPEQWFWMHHRWRTRPEDDEDKRVCDD